MSQPRLLLWSRWVVSWLGEARLLWLTLGVVGVAIAFASSGPWQTEPRIRITGLLLQLLGLATVVWGIRQTGEFFGHPTLRQALAAWILRFPSYHGKVVSGTAHMSGGFATVSGRGSARVSAKEGASPEERIDALEKNLGYLSRELDHTQQTLDETKRALAAAIKTESSERRTALEAVHRKLETAQTGGLYIAASGTLFLVVGVIMSTASLELSRLVP
jgi:hypothetical protein